MRAKRFGTEWVSYREFLRALPSFCWQTYAEVLTFSEMVDEEISPDVVLVELCRLARAGQIERRVETACYFDKRRSRFKYKGRETHNAG